MKIIHAHKYYYLRAGAERYMLGLKRMQEATGHTVVPFAMHHPKNLPSTWDEFFVSEIETETGVQSGLGALRQFKRALWSHEAERKMAELLDSIRPDVVHVHNIYTHLSPSILRPCKKRNIPVVMTLHDYGSLSANHALWNNDHPVNLERLGVLDTASTRCIKNSYSATLALALIEKWHHFRRAYDRAVDRYLPVSDFVKQVGLKTGLSEDKMQVVYPFSDLVCQNKKTDAGYVLFVGALENYKGAQTLIEAMKDFPSTTLKIAGTGSYESQLRNDARRLPNVEFLGFVRGAGLSKLMSEARVLVAPSIWYEPFGLVVVEAMSCGTPVIVSDRGGLPEIVEQGVSGRIFKAGDVADLSEKLKDILFDDALVRSLGEVGKERALALGDPQAHLAQILEIYQEIIANK